MKKKRWVDLLPWAVLAYNSSVHKALSMGHTGISPAEIFLGRRLRLAVEVMKDKDKGQHMRSARPEQQVVEVKEQVLRAIEWMQECRQKYEARMEEEVLKRCGKKDREFEVGDLVKVHRVTGPRTTAKLSRTKDVQVQGGDSLLRIPVWAGCGKLATPALNQMRQFCQAGSPFF